MAIFIKLNLCGRIFEVDLDILLTSELFTNLLQDSEYNDLPIVMNRSPLLFEHVLAYMIDPNYPYPSQYKLELDYYGIKYKSCELYNPYFEYQARIEQLNTLFESKYSILEDKLINLSLDIGFERTDDSVSSRIIDIENKINDTESKIYDLTADIGFSNLY